MKSALLALLLVSVVEAQEAGSDGQSLAQAASDPTASLMNVQLSDWYTANYWNLPDESANQFVIRTAYPFAWGKTKHIMRLTVPFVTHHPALSSGLSDITLFDLMVFDKSWGRWGVGPVALLPTGSSEMSVTYNWDTSEWSSLPLGASILKMTKPGSIPVQWSFQYEYNFADDQVVAKNLFRFTAKLLFPTR